MDALARLRGARRDGSSGGGPSGDAPSDEARASDQPDRAKLPKGAEAALWSIIEAVPDPRNHLALTRDLSGEVRITDIDRAAAAAAFGVDKDDPALVLEPQPVIDVRDKIDTDYDLGAIAENTPLTNHLFADSES